jgi:hypothetical protein
MTLLGSIHSGDADRRGVVALPPDTGDPDATAWDGFLAFASAGHRAFDLRGSTPDSPVPVAAGDTHLT